MTVLHVYFLVIQVFLVLFFLVRREYQAVLAKSLILPVESEERQVCIEESQDLGELSVIYLLAYFSFMLIGWAGAVLGW